MDVTQAIQAGLVLIGLGLFLIPRRQPRSRRAALSLILFSAAALVPMVRAGRLPTDVEQFAIGAIVLLGVALAIGVLRSTRR